MCHALGGPTGRQIPDLCRRAGGQARAPHRSTQTTGRLSSSSTVQEGMQASMSISAIIAPPPCTGSMQTHGRVSAQTYRWVPGWVGAWLAAWLHADMSELVCE